MNLDHIPTVDHDGLRDLLINMGTVQTIMVWGPPGIGKSQVIEDFGRELGMPVSILLGSQMSPEDLAVPLIDPQRYVTRLCPPETLMRDEASVVFIDELNAAEPDVMRAFFPIINERRIGTRYFPEGTLVVCAANPTSFNSVARPVPAPLMSRMYHVHLKVTSTRGWLAWAAANNVHPLIHEFIAETGLRSLIGTPGDDDQISTNPRSWAIASRALHGWNVDSQPDAGSPEFAKRVQKIVQGAVARKEAEEFGAWLSRRTQGLSLQAILRGEQQLPDANANRALVAHLISLLRSRITSELPRLEADLRSESRQFTDQAVALLQRLAHEAPELAGALLADEAVPAWFLDRLGRRLASTSN
ncbi:AAA family ATPase [Deinococcus peraridilitoris]|uniref:ATPase family protein associated with various cellular activities (AAA) n=1 Tax=Deinococcus peraridilitoris (strain DSM 19664 / LMG 22246 / CIP 109416 / KR-200) TaxID=937777 RepID=L0A211_DEIPD|nr:MoxR family ATPase [Deinococcus peraridilitoris]AFZ67202.1 ATPase family protein associated with various cellular activities (AAA) [Deinococcus peraridilitoris DSM 19664]